MLFAKYSLREMKCAGLFRLRVGICSIQAFILFFSCISNCAFSLVGTLCAEALLLTPPTQIIILLNIILSVSPVIGRSNAHAYESLLCRFVVPVVFFTLIRCCVQFYV